MKFIRANSIQIITVILVTFAVGMFTGKLVFAKKHTPRKLSANTSSTNPQSVPSTNSSSYRFINPILASIESEQISLDELISFKPQIEKYIKDVKKKYPNLYVAYYFRNLNNGLVIGINENDLFSPASLMKVAIMITVLKEAETKPGLLTTRIQYIKDDFDGVDEESGFEKKDGEWYSVEELIRQMIAYSDNAAALILMEYISMEKIAATENALNLQIASNANINTNFVAIKRYAAIFRILYNAAYLNKNMSEKALSILSQSVYDKGIRAAVPAQYPLAQKYGSRDMFDKTGNRKTLQLHQFGIVYVPEKPYLIGVMTRGATKEVKEKIIYDLAKITHTEVEKVKQ